VEREAPLVALSCGLPRHRYLAYPSAVIVLGVAPGLEKLAYAVLSFRRGLTVADPIDCDVVHSTGHSETAPTWRVSRSARVHHLIMGTVFDRDPPAVLALGPPLDPEEPSRSVDSVRTVMLALAMGLRARVVQFETEEDVRLALRAHYGEDVTVGVRGLRKAVRYALASELPTKNRRILLAAASALAGAFQVKNELS